MKSKLEIELDSFQKEYRICGNELFNDWFLSYADLQDKKCRFDVQWTRDSDKTLVCTYTYVATKLNLDELKKLLAVLGISESDYRTDQDIALSEELLFNKLLPQFKDTVKERADRDPDFLKTYQIESRHALEKIAIAGIQEACDEIIKYYKKHTSWNKQDELLLDIALCTNSILGQGSKLDVFISRGINKLTEYLVEYSADSIKKLSLAVASLKNNFDAYNSFNQSLLRSTASKVLDEVEEFSQHYDISEAKCDFFEEMLMRMAGITEMPTSSSIHQKDYDKTRFVIIVENMQKADVSKFLNLFKSLGDETAFTGYSRKKQQHQSSYSLFKEEPECASSLESMKISYSQPKTNRFEVDGALLYEKVLPAFKDFVTDLAQKDSSQLSKYQEASKAYLAMVRKVQAESVANNSDSLFNPSKKMRISSQSDRDNEHSSFHAFS